MFGRPIEGEKVAHWGARAIYQGSSRDYYIDLVFNRQSGEGGDERFFDWINKRALPWLREEVQDVSLSTSDADTVLVFEEGVYRLEACTNASYGYLYIGAVQRPGEAGTEPIEALSTKRICAKCGKKQIKTSKRFRRIKGKPGLYCQKCSDAHYRVAHKKALDALYSY